MAMKELPIPIFIIMILVHLSEGEIEITVLAGQNTTLPCMFEGIPSHVRWLKALPLEDRLSWNIIAGYGGNTNPGTIDNGKYKVQKDFSPGNSSFSLTIADVEIADAGRYRCAVTDLNGAIFSSLYHLKVLDALYTSVATLNTSGHESATASVIIPALHGTSTTPALTQTVTSASTDKRNQTMDDTGSVISHAAKLGIAFGVIFGVVIIVVALVIIARYKKKIREAIKQRRCQRSPNGSTRSPSPPNRDDKENEAVNKTLMTTVC